MKRNFVVVSRFYVCIQTIIIDNGDSALEPLNRIMNSDRSYEKRLLRIHWSCRRKRDKIIDFDLTSNFMFHFLMSRFSE